MAGDEPAAPSTACRRAGGGPGSQLPTDGGSPPRSPRRRKRTPGWPATRPTLGGALWVDPQKGRITLEEYSTRWIDQRTDLRPRTEDDYRDIIRVHIAPKLGDEQLGKLTPGDVRSWYATLSAKVPGRARKAYRLLRAILNTAVADEIIVRNPCRVRGAGQDRSAERPIATVAEVAALADAVDQRLRALVLLAGWCGLRRAELLALRRRDVDVLHTTVRVERSMHTRRDNSIVIGPPKTDAGRRTVAIPPHIVADLEHHLGTYVAADADSLLFTERAGGPLRLYTVERAWRKARTAVGVEQLRLHDLRHTGNTLAAATGASTKELMARHGSRQPPGGAHLPARHRRPRPGHRRRVVRSRGQGGGGPDPASA